jgi:5'-nucleotidase / UDP-sugar diphosphatase
MMLRKIVSLVSLLLIAMLVISFAAAQDEETFSLTIMHTNDEHAGHEPDANGDGGAAREATVVEQIRGEVEHSLLLDGGDRFTGSLFHVEYRGQDNAMIMNGLGYDAMTLGNHEFDDGDEVLAAFISALEFPVVTANVDFSQSIYLAGLVESWVILDIGSEQIGIIGLVTPETEILSKPGPELVFDYDLVGVTQGAVDELTEMGINKIVLLTHIGYNTDLEVAQAVSGVDVVVGGHTNTFLSNTYTGAAGEYPTVLDSATGEPVLVVQASTKTKYLGRLDVVFDAEGVLADWSGDAILLSRYISPDSEISDMIAGLAEPIEALRGTPVGDTEVFLVGDRAVCRFAECNLGNLITDAMIAETGAQIALQNSGGIRASIPNADTPDTLELDDLTTVTLGDVLTVLPFGNLTSTFEITGADLWAALEHGVSVAENTENEGTGRFLQVGGLRYSWDGSQEVGSRLVSVDILNADGDYEPLDLDATYTAVTNDFTRTGGDGFEMLRDNAINAYDFGRPLDQVLADYIAANSPVAPELEGRITRVDVTE